MVGRLMCTAPDSALWAISSAVSISRVKIEKLKP